MRINHEDKGLTLPPYESLLPYIIKPKHPNGFFLDTIKCQIYI